MGFFLKKSTKLVKNEKGQMAIFLVLIFQVLFVFFAMAINMGLVVHDKVNLQNSTDLAAYYGASKQAELLNQIGHVNYQIRQAYKLLAFRIRVIGSVAMGYPPINTTLPLHPLFQPGRIGQENTAHFSHNFGGARNLPGVCAASTLWHEYQITESQNSVSFCKDLNAISFVPGTGGGGGPLGGLVSSLDRFLTAVREEATDKCNRMGVINWQIASRFLVQYRLDATKRSKMIRHIAEKVSKSGSEMTDFRGQSVYQGTEKTLKRNLTDPQRDNLSMQLINSLSEDVPSECSNPNFWLPPVETFPVVTYVNMDAPSGRQCSLGVRASRGGGEPSSTNLSRYGGGSTGFLLEQWRSGAATPMGVEKNPWCMPYMGVIASTRPRKLFSPLGGGISLRAQAFAKPFGGRIGPWYFKIWNSGSATSTGSGKTDKVDPLLPSRSIAGSPTGGSTQDDLANYSKYPGDTHGLNSKYALGVMSNYFRRTMLGGSGLNSSTPVFALAHYNHVGNPSGFDSEKDSLARAAGSGPSGTLVRNIEEAAIAPDLFDITYYSIDARHSSNFFNQNNNLFVTNTPDYYLDLGSSNSQLYNVESQISKTGIVYQSNSPFYMVNDTDQLLTGWTQQKVVDYSFPDLFGRCLNRITDEGVHGESPAPSGCPAGGRSGYSVKIVSKDYLKSVSADLGGPGQNGAILNPPPDSP